MTPTIIPIAAHVDDDDDDDDVEGVAVWYAAARDIQNRVSRVVGTDEMEGRQASAR